MRHIFILAILMIVINGCGQNSNPVSISDTIKSGTLEYTFSTSKPLYEPHDTLKAAVSVFNNGTTNDTISVGDGIFQWNLQNSKGQIIMVRGVSDNVVGLVIINPGQTKQIYSINQVIADTSGKAVIPGSYSLNASLHPSLSFSLKLSIQ